MSLTNDERKTLVSVEPDELRKRIQPARQLIEKIEEMVDKP